ncbi:MAG: hypothetical protein AAB604_00285 [Patescibacteria group bacterium]
MLEKATLEEITKLRLAPGEEVTVLAVRHLAPGMVVRVTTKSPGKEFGNCYLFEITDPKTYRAHVVRCDPRGPDSLGYRGEKVVSIFFRIGGQILLGGADGVSFTSAVVDITILPKEVLK